MPEPVIPSSAVMRFISAEWVDVDITAQAIRDTEALGDQLADRLYKGENKANSSVGLRLPIAKKF